MRIKYSPELAEKICLRIMNGESLLQICSNEMMPTPQSVHYWRITNPMFERMYDIAIKARTEMYVEDIIRLSDMATDLHSAAAIRVRIDARKWLAGKLMPKRYGEYVQTGGGRPYGLKGNEKGEEKEIENKLEFKMIEGGDGGN